MTFSGVNANFPRPHRRLSFCVGTDSRVAREEPPIGLPFTSRRMFLSKPRE